MASESSDKNHNEIVRIIENMNVNEEQKKLI